MALAAALASAPASYAQESAAQAAYPNGFYAAFAPQTALDMLKRTPGFSLVSGGSLRGLGGDAGNVLIDGRRPIVKSGGVDEVLGRIAANQVDRIELLRGGETADAQGRALIANVVLRQAAKPSGAVSFELRRAPHADEVTPRLEGSYARTLGDWRTSVGALAYYETNPIGGRYVLSGPDGATTDQFTEHLDQSMRGGYLTGSGERALGGGVLSLTSRLAGDRERYTQTLGPAAAPTAVAGQSDSLQGELGADWSGRLHAGWTMNLVGLARFGGEVYSEASEDDAFEQTQRTVELVGRATASGDGGWRPQAGVEVAYNRLDSDLAYLGGGDDTQVSEARFEVFASASRRLAPAWQAEAGLAFEGSRIGVSGDREQTLGFLKPFAAVTWTPTATSELRLEARRQVSQLDFAAFAASADLVDDRPLSGNAELRPEITTGLTASLDRRFGVGGAVTLKLVGERIEDATAYVPLVGGGQALVNATPVTRWWIEGDAAVPLDRLLPDARVTVSGWAQREQRDDPVTGRPLDTPSSGAELEFRQDLPRRKAAYGFVATAATSERDYYAGEVQTERTGRYVTAYAETTALAGLKTTLTLSGVGGERVSRYRDMYAPTRAGVLTGREVRERRRREPYVNLMFAKQF